MGHPVTPELTRTRFANIDAGVVETRLTHLKKA
jgi:hypothetical protein